MLTEIRIIQGREVINLLELIFNNKIELEVAIDRSLPPAKTTIRSLNSETGFFEIFTFSDERANQKIAPGQLFAVRVVVNDVPYFFQPALARSGKGIRFHILKIPTEVKLLQRRKFYRLKPPKPDALLVRVCYDPKTSRFQEAPQVHDLSLGGIGILDFPQIAANPKQKIVELKLSFEDEITLEIEAAVRYIRHIEEGTDKRLIGMQFQSVSQIHETYLQKVISNWQRQTCRTIKLVH